MLESRIKTIPERVQLWKTFYQRENPRPLFGFFVGSEYPVERYPSTGSSIPENKPLVPSDIPAQNFLEDSERLFQAHEKCGGDFIWAGSAFWGVPWLEAAIGCPITLPDRSTGSIRNDKMPGFEGPADIPRFNPSNPWMQKAVELLSLLAEQSGGRWPLGATRMRGIADLLSALYGAENLIFSMIERPGEVHACARILTDWFIGFGQLQISSIPDFHGGTGSFYYNAWAPAGTIWHQEDAAALLSPELYSEFIQPHDERIIKSFKGCIIHQHSTGYIPVEHYLRMKPSALELHIDSGGPSAEELYPIHTQILEKSPLIIWGDISEEDLARLFSTLPSEGLAVITTVQNEKYAQKLWNLYRSHLPGLPKPCGTA